MVLSCSFEPRIAGASTSVGDGGSTMSVGVSSSGSAGSSTGSEFGSPPEGPSSPDQASSQGSSNSNGNNNSNNGSSNNNNSGSSNSNSGTSTSDCTYHLAPASDQTVQAPAGVTSPGNWYLVECQGGNYAQIHRDGVVWVPTPAPTPAAGAGSAAAPPVPAIDPAVVAQQAENSLRLTAPQIETNPSTRAIVNLPTWLWVGQGTWGPESVSASIATVTATATATPEQVVWTMGDGGTVTCNGPGTAYQPSVPAESQTTDCSYTYRRSSAGEPAPNGDPNSAGFPVSATVTWGVSWTAQGIAAGGTLAPLTTSSSISLPVEQIQSVSADGQ